MVVKKSESQKTALSWLAARSRQIMTALKGLWQNVRPWLWRPTTVALLILISLIVVRPFAPPPSDPSAYEIQEQWNDSISRLGIEPVFPPEEEFYVGDIWAVVSGAADKAFLRKAVRIGNVDMRSFIRAKNGAVPVFAETSIGKPGDELTLQNNKEIDPRTDDKHIFLTVVAFPGVSITHVTKASTFLGLNIGSTAAERNGLQIEETKIPYAETYGVSTSIAVGALDEWCNSSLTKNHCTYQFAKSMLSFALGSKLLEMEKDHTIGSVGDPKRIEINIVMITRVFMTRELDTRRVTSSSLGGALRIVPVLSGVPEEETSAAGINHPRSDTKPDDGTKTAIEAQSQNCEVVQGRRIWTALFGETNGSSVGARQVFPRPVVFGFRSVSIMAPDP